MSWIIAPNDETHVWVPGKSEVFGTYPGTSVPFGMASTGHWEPRPPEDVARIRAEKQRKHEDEVLAEADVIRARRSSEGRDQHG